MRGALLWSASMPPDPANEAFGAPHLPCSAAEIRCRHGCGWRHQSWLPRLFGDQCRWLAGSFQRSLANGRNRPVADHPTSEEHFSC